MALSFTDIEGDLVDTKDLNYSVRGFEDGGSDINYDLTSGSASETIELILNLGKNREIRKSLTFHYDKYYVDLSVKLINMDRYIDGREYDIYWGGGLGYSETGMDDDRYAKAYILLGVDERVDVNAGTKNMGKRESFSGNTEWIAERTKYFSMAIIPKGTPGKGAYVIPQYEVIDKQQRLFYKYYVTGMKINFRDDNIQEDRFQVFLGPNDLDLVKELGVNLEKRDY